MTGERRDVENQHSAATAPDDERMKAPSGLDWNREYVRKPHDRQRSTTVLDEFTRFDRMYRPGVQLDDFTHGGLRHCERIAADARDQRVGDRQRQRELEREPRSLARRRGEVQCAA